MNPLPQGLNESILAGAVEGAVVRSVRDCAAVTEALAVHRQLGRSFMPAHPRHSSSTNYQRHIDHCALG